MMYIRSHKKHSPIVFAAIFCIFAIVVFVFVYKKLLTKSETITAKHLALQEERAQLGDMLGRARLVESSTEDLAVFNTLFVTEQTLPSFLAQLEAYATKTNLLIDVEEVYVDARRIPDGIADKEEKKTKTSDDIIPKVLVVQLRLGGSFNEILRYISLLEALPQSADITTMALHETEDTGVYFEGSEYPWEGEVELTIFSYQQ